MLTLFEKRKLKKLSQSDKRDSFRDCYGNPLGHLLKLYALDDEQNQDDKLVNQFGQTLEDIDKLCKIDLSNDAKLEIYSNKRKSFEFFDRNQMKQNFGFSYLDNLVVDHPKILKTIWKRCHKVMQNPALKWKNHWTLCMNQKDFESNRLQKTYVQWVDPLIGHGLFAKEDISKYSYIGQYTGIVRKRRSRTDLANDYIFGYMAGPKETPFVIDAKNFGNHTRFINHSLYPNVMSTWMIIKGICHIILFAGDFIPKGSQLTYDYGPYYWRKRPTPTKL